MPGYIKPLFSACNSHLHHLFYLEIVAKSYLILEHTGAHQGIECEKYMQFEPNM